MEFYFGEHLRLDWGFENPNKTASLIAGLLVASHLLRYFKANRQAGYWLFVIAFTALGVCLIQTYSRGGIIAAIAGQIAFFLTRNRPLRFPSRKAVFTALALGILLTGYASLPQVEALDRYSQGVGTSGEPDRSITNRLRIWKDVPQMILNAPGGWGKGKAGEAWMLWYQPMDTKYRYRTLVNSHFTWMVEFGWPGRFLYLTGWCLVLITCFAPGIREAKERRAAAISVGVWTTLAVSAFFSSVAESPILWSLPILCLVWMIAGSHKLRKSFLDFRSIAKPLSLSVGFAAISLLLILLAGHAMGEKNVTIHRSDNFLHCGRTEPNLLVIRPDKRVMGRHYSYEIREASEMGWLVSEEMPGEIPASITQVVVSGDIPDLAFDNFEGKIIYLNPLKSVTFDSGHEGKNRIILGALRRDPLSRVLRHKVEERPDWDLTLRKGKQIYLGNWVNLLSEESHP